MPSQLRDFDWKPMYSHEDGDLVELFFLPVLDCAKLYQRVTGYFNTEALTLAFGWSGNIAGAALEKLRKLCFTGDDVPPRDEQLLIPQV